MKSVRWLAAHDPVVLPSVEEEHAITELQLGCSEAKRIKHNETGELNALDAWASGAGSM
jgi:hypothetical protein